MSQINPRIEESWKEALSEEFNAPYFSELKKFLVDEKKKHQVYPPGPMIFNAFNHTPLDKVKVVLLGQDPYHGPGQAQGLCFSVPDGIRQPPSLQNIFKEIADDIGTPPPPSGDLTRWASQGILLLNATLTVRARTPGSHQGKGWEQFTDAAIKVVSKTRENVVFLLWGRYAQNKAALINPSKHLVLKAAHPSPFSAHNGFFGCKHFSKTNEWLKNHGLKEIEW
ncbi:MAG: uracil-DNA glycosylase [Anaerophaga sp.]|uniref:uracil-DNA glycosylase n=1 Tax=Anaerophaga thermohalophila TaxID=177400 RepID=UPI000237CF8B|nr:uracil-DNA glycosylase [Anaerophaga thermohalophila]MBZ4676752.1 uracil-DNA glycosylase [Anaerophaga sp.]MDK2841995.1 uracil-DNA glycosylase [Anaerophaga sp.]MDN5290231.1 uracil-DNA glycosylase [Anaerophaga sp.]